MISQAGKNISGAPAGKGHERGSNPYDRSLVFFDAIYAFALTLLVTTIDPPSAESWRSLSALLEDGLGTQVLGFLVSFIVIVAFWRVNVRIVGRLTELTPQLVFVNVLTVGLIIFIPFTTEAFSDADAIDYVLPVVFYAINVSLLALMAIAMRELAINQSVYEDPPTPHARLIRLLDDLTAPIVILLSIPIAVVFGGTAAHYWWLILIVTGPLSGRLADRAIARLDSK